MFNPYIWALSSPAVWSPLGPSTYLILLCLYQVTLWWVFILIVPSLSPSWASTQDCVGVFHPSVFLSVVCLSLLVSALHPSLLLSVQCSGRQLSLAMSCFCWLVFYPVCPILLCAFGVHHLEVIVTLSLVIVASIDEKSTNRQFAINSFKASRALASRRSSDWVPYKNNMIRRQCSRKGTWVRQIKICVCEASNDNLMSVIIII